MHVNSCVQRLAGLASHYTSFMYFRMQYKSSRKFIYT